MSEEQSLRPPLQTQALHPNILNMTLGEILNHNSTAQNMIMQSMGLNQGQFQQMLNSAGNNQILNTKVSDLFKNGTIAQAMQINPQQIQQMLSNPNDPAMPMQTMAVGKIDPATGQMIPLTDADTQKLQQVTGLTLPSKKTFFQKLKSLFQ